MNTAGRKAKGRKLQQWVAENLRNYFGFAERDCKSTPMGCNGADILFSNSVSQVLPWSIECKNTQQGFTAAYNALEQCEANCEHGEKPVVIAKMNNKKPIAIVYYEEWQKRAAK